MTDTYLVAYDESNASQRALDFAVKLAKQANADLLIAHVLEWSPYSFLSPTELEERHMRRKEELARAKTVLTDPVVAATEAKGIKVRSIIRYGNVADTLSAIAQDEGAAQIIIGRTGKTDLAARVFGSVAGSLAQSAPIPCTIVP